MARDGGASAGTGWSGSTATAVLAALERLEPPGEHPELYGGGPGRGGDRRRARTLARTEPARPSAFTLTRQVNDSRNASRRSRRPRLRRPAAGARVRARGQRGRRPGCRRPAGRGDQPRRELRRGRPRRRARPRRSRPAACGRPATTTSSRPMDAIVICVPTPLTANRQPDLGRRRRRRHLAVARAARGAAGGARVDDLSGHDPRAAGAAARGVRAGGRPRLPRRLLARAGRSRAAPTSRCATPSRWSAG